MTLSLATVGRHALSIPGKHEARALTDACPDTSCFTYTTPAAVLDVHGKGRVAAYRCPKCSAGWLCWWSVPTGRQPHRLHQGSAPAAPPLPESCHCGRTPDQHPAGAWGTCTRCGSPLHRYGPGGRPRCQTCLGDATPTGL